MEVRADVVIATEEPESWEAGFIQSQVPYLPREGDGE